MMVSNAMISVRGTIESRSGAFALSAPACPAMAASAEDVAEAGSNPFGELVALYRSNEFLSTELTTVNRGLNSARAYLDTPGSNSVLAEARVRQLKARHSAVLTLLRANRIAARDLLARAGSEDEMSAA